jgi:hypothetical protein
MSDTNRRSKAYKDAMARVHFLIQSSSLELIATPTIDVRVADGSNDPDPFELSRAAGLDLRSLHVRASVNSKGMPYDMRIGYYNRRGWMDPSDVELMRRTLKVLDDGLASLAEKYGEVSGFGQYLARAADILSIRTFLLPADNGASTPLRAREAIEAIEALAQKVAGEQPSVSAGALKAAQALN